MLLSRTWRRARKGALALLFLYFLNITMADAVEFMPAKDVQTGMTGIAKTVLVGDKISTFNVKVLGVMKNRGPSGDLILAKFSGDAMNQTGGIAHGMSGSPVYIDGKLVGAVAYGWGFADGTIGMITPIDDMVRLWNIPYEKNMSNPWHDDHLIPLGTPLMAYGFDEDSLVYMKEKLPAYKFEAYDTAAANGDEVEKPLVAGGSVAALMVDGDLKLGAIGTVTYVDDDRIVAFGHPFLKRGSMEYFMHNAHIFTVVKSYDSAFKLGSMGAEVGAVIEDRGAGIAGISGKIAKGIPVSVYIKDLDMGLDRMAHVKTIEDGDMTPALVATSIYSFLNKTMDRTGVGTAKMTYTLTPKNSKYKPLTRTNMFYSNNSISVKAVDEIYNVLDGLMNNRFIDYNIMDVKVDTAVTKETLTAEIVDATASPVIVAPGDKIAIKVKIQPFRGEEEEKTLFFDIPKDQALGPATLEVRGGGVIPLPYLFERQKYNLTDEIIRRLKTYKDFDEFYEALKDADSNHQIVVEFLQEGVSMVDTDDKTSSKKAKIDNIEKKPVPGDIKKPKVQESAPAVDKKDKKEVKSYIDTDYIIKGDGQFQITVVGADKKEKALKAYAKKRTSANDKTKLEAKATLIDKAKTE